MKKLQSRVWFIVILTLVASLYIFPWKSIGYEFPIPAFMEDYKLGLDLHGGVELDYKVDLDNVTVGTGQNAALETKNIIEGIKSVVERRVNSLGLAEPTIQTANYGPNEAHIIVQIPTKNYDGLTAEEKKLRNAEDIVRAKETIGKVVQLEFREQKSVITEADKTERKALAEKALSDIKGGLSFSVAGAKYRDGYENVLYSAGSGSLPVEAEFPGIESITQFPHQTEVVTTHRSPAYDMSGNVVEGEAGYTIVLLKGMNEVEKFTGTGGTTEKEKHYDYEFIFVSESPSAWAPAKTADGKVLNDKYLERASVVFSDFGAPQVQLLFNAEGARIFGDLTSRLIGKPIAIYVGGTLLTAPTVQAKITDGRAVITGNYGIEEAKLLANNINTGIVPAPIYLTSERTIDAKIGADSLSVILYAGLIGLAAIIVFLMYFYHIGGLLAGLALVIYAILLIALVKFFGIVLTLASIAGVILSIGLAIDANILIFERMKEALRSGDSMEKAIQIGFAKSWSAIWDSHITSLTSAIILYIFGISLIKGFGFMLGLGIVLSLFTAMWVSRILIAFAGRNLTAKQANFFIGLHK